MQGDAGVEPTPNPSDLPSIILEVGSSESLTQLKIDASLWLETAVEVSWFLPSLPIIHQNFFRCSWSSFFQLTPPLLPNQIFQE